jgi:DNA-binding NtrC family response regulator
MNSIKKRILVIDDDSSVRSTICMNIRDCGYEVIEADNGNTALNILASEKLPDLVITDMIMPYKNGLDTIVAINEKYPSLHVIAISGGAAGKSNNLLAMAEKTGAKSIIQKPFVMHELEKLIDSLLNNSSRD